MTKLASSNPHKISITEDIPNVAKYLKDAADIFAYLTSWIDPARLIDELAEEGLHVAQINQDLKWLCTKLKRAEAYRSTPEIAEFERELILRVRGLNQYAGRLESALDCFKSLTFDLEELDVEDKAHAIRLARQKWEVLEKTVLKELPSDSENGGRE